MARIDDDLEGDDLEGTEPGPQPSRPQPQDGRVNFSAYLLEQLRELQFTIDPSRFPQNHENLLAALAEKTAQEDGTADQSHSIMGRFTKRAGLIGWVQAKFARSPVYGPGALACRDGELVLCGWQRSWLGAAIEISLTRDEHQVWNVLREGLFVYFELERRHRLPQRIAFQCHTEPDAQRLEAMLPRTQTVAFAKQWAEISEFNRSLREISGEAGSHRRSLP